MKKLAIILIVFLPLIGWGQIVKSKGVIVRFTGNTVTKPDTSQTTISCDSIVPCNAIIPCDAIYSYNFGYYNEDYIFNLSKYFKHEENLTV